MDKIILRFQLLIFFGMVFFQLPKIAHSQDTILNKYGLWIITNVEVLRQTIKNNPAKAMCNLKKIIPGIALDIRYATTNNFMHQKLYPPVNTAWLRKAAGDSLIFIQKELNKKGLGLKIFDAYRPYSVTEKMWEPIKDDRYVADPIKGSGHNRGIAVDLTIINLITKEELNMGTGFDNFSDTAHHNFIYLPEDVLQNRLLLKSIMEKHGFKALDTEWWHYYLSNVNDFELMDLSFDELDKIKN